MAAYRDVTVAADTPPGKNCFWVTNGVKVGTEPMYKNYGKRDKSGKNNSAVIATVPNGASISYEWCGQSGWTRHVYKGQLGWMYRTHCDTPNSYCSR